MTTNTLPEIIVEITGKVLTSTLPEFASAARAYIEQINMLPSTDEEFGEAEAVAKELERNEKLLEEKEVEVINQTSDISQIIQTLKSVKGLMRDTRLTLTKVVKIRKEAIKGDILEEAKNRVAAALAEAEEKTKPIKLRGFVALPLLDDAAKNKKTPESIAAAVNSVANSAVKIINLTADDVAEKLKWLKLNYSGYSHLFPDLQTVIFRDSVLLEELVTSRVNTYLMQVEIDESKKESEQTPPEPEKPAPAKQASPEPAPKAEAKPAEIAPGKSEPPMSEKPTDEQIVQAIADSFGVDLLVAIEWLLDVDMEAMSAKLFEAL
jgi:hypothetical protein